MLIDSHCHLTAPPLMRQVDALIGRAREAGVSHVVTIGTGPDDARRAADLAAARPEVFSTAGVHPHEAGKAPDGWEEALERLLGEPRVVAVGETGLDYHYDYAPRDAQRRVFEAQLALADRVGKPVIIHCREAQEDALAVLRGFPRLGAVVFHCFTGTEAEASAVLDGGHWISLTGVVTFRNADELRRVAAMLPADRLMVETDAPYLSPEPVRSRKPNEPAHVAHIARVIAGERRMAWDEFVARSRANTVRFFGLPLA